MADKEVNEQAIPAVTMDGDVKEIYGRPTGLEVFKKKGTDRWEGGTLTVTDIDGKEHTATFTGISPVYMLYLKVGGSKVCAEMLELSRNRDRTSAVKKAFAARDPIIARIDEADRLFATMTTKWKRNEIEVVLPVIEKTFPDYEVDVTPSDGKYGGMAIVELGQIGIMAPKVIVSMGPKDGQHAVKISAAGEVLYCSNQLTAEVRHELKSLIPEGSNFYLAQRHSQTILDLEWFEEQLHAAKVASMALVDALEASKEIPMTQELAEAILRYYYDAGVMSQRSAKASLECYQNKESAQVPDTLFGLIMGITYFGTHGEKLQGGVRNNMAILGAELVIMSTNWDEFRTFIGDKMEGLESDIFHPKEEETPEETPEESDDEPKTKKSAGEIMKDMDKDTKAKKKAKKK